MPSLWKRLSRPEAEPYQFPAAESLGPAQTPAEPPPQQEDSEPENPGPQEEMQDFKTSPLNYAEVQADQMVRAARRQAEEILEQARREAREQSEILYEKARGEGWEAGYADGVRQGTAQALEENQRLLREKSQALTAELERFLEQANAALDRQMDENVDELRDLAIAVAEKVVAVSLKSSSDVIERMIQAAVDKRKRREWVRIYVAECDAKRMTKLSPALAAALSSLSDHVRIIPMVDDEAGTCIIEMPDEIIDASAATQLQNIRAMLDDLPADGAGSRSNFKGGAFDRVPPHDTSGL